MDALQKLQSRNDLPSELHSSLQQMEALFRKKLWHQLTSKMLEFIKLPASGPLQPSFYEEFVSTFASHIDQIKLVQIAAEAARQISDARSSLEFMRRVAQNLDSSSSPEAYVAAQMEGAQYSLALEEADSAQNTIAECRNILDTLDSVKPIVHAIFYKVTAEFHKKNLEYSEYYNNALLYLACIEIQDLSESEALQRANDLAIAALLGSNTYNFGELLLHPILQLLSVGGMLWLKNLLEAYNSGSIGKFEGLLGQVTTNPILQDHYAFLRQKICLMALIEVIFAQPAGRRVVSFETIATFTALPVHEVEHLLMKALSLKLIRGRIDQVNRFAAIAWVQPRILNQGQVAKLDQELHGWAERIKITGDFAASQAPDIFVL